MHPRLGEIAEEPPAPEWAKAALLVGCPMLLLAASRQGVTRGEQSARDGDSTGSQS